MERDVQLPLTKEFVKQLKVGTFYIYPAMYILVVMRLINVFRICWKPAKNHR